MPKKSKKNKLIALCEYFSLLNYIRLCQTDFTNFAYIFVCGNLYKFCIFKKLPPFSWSTTS